MLKKTALVSIIIPTFNRAHLIEETLDSVLAQTYKNWECIVIDDGSTDNTAEVLKTYTAKDSRFQYHHRPNNRPKGANTCRGLGFELSKGEFVNWFDSDDLMHKDHLKIKLDEITTHKCDFVLCEVAKFKTDLSNLRPIKNLYTGNPVKNQFMGMLTLFTPGPLWNKEFLIKHQLNYNSAKVNTVLNDWVFGIEALIASNNFKYIEQVLIFYRSHENSIYSSRKTYPSTLLVDEYKIRKKMWQLLSVNKLMDSNVDKYYNQRILYIIRYLFRNKDKKTAISIAVELIKKLLLQVKLYDCSKVVIACVVVSCTNRGYNLLKL